MNNQYRWNSRLQRLRVDPKKLKKYSFSREKFLPVEFSGLLKRFVAKCRDCGVPFYPTHLEQHGLKRVQLKEVFEDLRKIKHQLQKKTKKQRRDYFSI